MQVVAVNSNQLDAKLGKAGSGFKEQVERLAKQISEVAEGMPQHVARRLAGIVQGIFANPKGAMTASIAAGAIAQAHGVILVNMFEPTQAAPGTGSLIQNVNNWSLGYRIVGRQFTNNEAVAVRPKRLRMFGYMEDAFGDEHDPRLQTNNSWAFTVHPIVNGQFQHPSVLVGKERFGNGGYPQIDITTTSLTNSRGRPVYEFTVDLSNSNILFNPGESYLVSFMSEANRMGKQFGNPGLRAVNTYTTLNDPNVSQIGWTIQNNGEFYSSTHEGNGMISSLELTGEPVPEPASMVALGLGVAALARKRRSPK
jgi:hypothetical protein